MAKPVKIYVSRDCFTLWSAEGLDLLDKCSCIYKMYKKGKKPKEIAKRLKTDKDTVKSIIACKGYPDMPMLMDLAKRTGTRIEVKFVGDNTAAKEQYRDEINMAAEKEQENGAAEESQEDEFTEEAQENSVAEESQEGEFTEEAHESRFTENIQEENSLEEAEENCINEKMQENSAAAEEE